MLEANHWAAKRQPSPARQSRGRDIGAGGASPPFRHMGLNWIKICGIYRC